MKNSNSWAEMWAYIKGICPYSFHHHVLHLLPCSYCKINKIRARSTISTTRTDIKQGQWWIAKWTYPRKGRRAQRPILHLPASTAPAQRERGREGVREREGHGGSDRGDPRANRTPRLGLRGTRGGRGQRCRRSARGSVEEILPWWTRPSSPPAI
jgi:hypothetical protein